MKKSVFATLAVLGLTACAEHPLERQLTVDGGRNSDYAADKQACLSLASRYNDGSAKNDAIVGAVIGGLVGAAEDDLEGALVGATLGGALGSAEGKTALDKERRNVLIRCMQGRGHNVVG